MTKTRYTLRELAELTQSQLIGDPDLEITGVDALDTAGPSDASFLANPRYLSQLKQTQAGVVCVTDQAPREPGRNLLVSSDPSTAFQKILEALFPIEESLSGFTGIHPTAQIHPTARLGAGVQVGPYAVIDKEVHIGDHTVIGPGVHIGPHVKIGQQCHLHSHVTVRERCILGNRVIIQPGAVIGSCGFGFSTNAQGEHTKLEQLGHVLIEDDVEIGANTTIDRARFKTTRIGKGTKIDNLVQIGHNVDLGPHNLVVSQTGIAGSVKTGRNVIFGGQAGVVGHIEIADHVLIASRGGVSKSMPTAGKYAGSPVLPLIEHNRQQVHLRHIADYVKQLSELQKRVDTLESLP